MKRVIFTSYDDIDTKENSVNEYFDRLVENKRNYAKSIGVEFILYHNTMDSFDIDGELEFTKVNLYKHHLMAELAKDYDEVMYVDMDVVFNTTENVFEQLDLDKGIHILDQDEDIQTKNIDEIIWKNIGLRNPTLKYHITKHLLDGGDNHVINTGIMIAKSEHIQQINFVERMYEAINKINELKQKPEHHIISHYYPNNESVFSYILEKYNIPYVLLDKEWHYIYDHRAIEKGIHGKILHFINKNFSRFFNDKTKAIFSLYVKIDDELLDNPNTPLNEDMNKSKRTQLQLEKYFDDLNQNKIDYANSIGADYVLFENDESYQQFRKRFPQLSEYNIVNLYKIYCLELLCKKYDKVLYLDFDVACRRMDVDVFDHVYDYKIGVEITPPEDHAIYPKSEAYFKYYEHDFRSPHAKYWNAHAMLSEEGLDPDHSVFNTGIVTATKYVMDKLKYFEDIESTISFMAELKEDEFSMYPDNIRKSFGYDNETIMSYKVKLNEVDVHHLSQVWHYKHSFEHVEGYEGPQTSQGRIVQNKYYMSMIDINPVFVHFISKQFGLEYGFRD